MSEPFFGQFAISSASWAAFERILMRLLILEGFSNCSVVGTSGDGGADVVGTRNGQRWVLQAKAYAGPIGADKVDEVIRALRRYRGDIPVLVSKSGFTAEVFESQRRLAEQGIRLQLWDARDIQRRGQVAAAHSEKSRRALRPYQDEGILGVCRSHEMDASGSALVVLATGLGKTVVAAEALRRMRRKGERVLVLAHTTDLVLQLERAFWPTLGPDEATTVVIGNDRPKLLADLHAFPYIFATKDSIDSLIQRGHQLPPFRYVVVDECHHLGAEVYEAVLSNLDVGNAGGPFLLGLTATPWRPDGSGLDHRFDEPVISVDLARGLREGYLANVDYRMYTDNIDWERIRSQDGRLLSPKAINRTLFISEWDDAVVEQMQSAWAELSAPRKAIVFCGNVDHARRMADRINALGFATARAIYSTQPGRGNDAIAPFERNALLWDFADGRIDILCAVDILNEGVDVPDVNMVVFQRVTHSRRIFTQQLGRGLRLAEGKTKVIVLDFVTDIRRFAAGLSLDRQLSGRDAAGRTPYRVQIHSQVSFRRANAEDADGRKFLEEWLQDLEAIEIAGDDTNVLRFPPQTDITAPM